MSGREGRRREIVSGRKELGGKKEEASRVCMVQSSIYTAL